MFSSAEARANLFGMYFGMITSVVFFLYFWKSELIVSNSKKQNLRMGLHNFSGIQNK